ncbi:MAG TPA: DUF5706 domain-containing protein [Ignavibacteria bacterium]|nr:DUF5706 domain-containing protein [Ignavibacteria bacterium]
MTDTYRKTDLALKLYESTQNLIRFADTKINVLSFVNGIATSFVITNFQQLFEINLFSKFIMICFFLSFIVFVYFLLNTILPRGNKNSEIIGTQLVFFGHVAKRNNAKEYINDFNNTNSEEFLDDLLQQIYESAKIATTKFGNYKKGLITLQFQIFFFFILLGIKSFVNQ